MKTYTLVKKTHKIELIKRGNSRKFCYSAPRWVIYHLKRMQRSYRNPQELEHVFVYETDLKAGTITKISAKDFLIIHSNSTDITKNILSKFGIEVDIKTLKSMYDLKLLNENVQSEVADFLQANGISC